MNKIYLILLLFLGVIFFSQCKKSEEQWAYCFDCDLDEWVGSYEGSGVYYSDIDGESEMDATTTVVIENTSGTILKTSVAVDEHFSTTFTVNKTTNDYFIEMPGSNRSLSLTLSKKGSGYKLSGTVKLFHYKSDTIYTDHSISFDAFKNQQ